MTTERNSQRLLNENGSLQDKADWKTCGHKFLPWFGPVLRCRLCGATTMVTMDKNEAKAIHRPLNEALK